MAAILGTLHCHADTIILKNGTRYEGRVLKDEGDSLLLEIQVTRSIRDERRIPKADIERIEKSDPVEDAFAKLENITKTPDLFSVDQYQSRIRMLEEFLRQHPLSSRTKEVKKMIAELEAERDQVAEGSVKLDGRMIPPDRRRGDAVGIDATIRAHRMRETLDAGQLIEALRIFDTLEADFPGTKAHLDSIELARGTLEKLRTRVNKFLVSLEERTRNREVGLERMPAVDRVRAEQIFAQQRREFEARVAEETAANAKWLSIDPFDRNSLEDALRRVESESSRLAHLDTSNLPRIDVEYREIWSRLEDADEQTTEELLNRLNHLQLPPRYEKMLRERSIAAAPESDD